MRDEDLLRRCLTGIVGVQPLQDALDEYGRRYEADWSRMMAAKLVTSSPPVFLSAL